LLFEEELDIFRAGGKGGANLRAGWLDLTCGRSFILRYYACIFKMSFLLEATFGLFCTNIFNLF
jgi:hypothetical protein